MHRASRRLVTALLGVGLLTTACGSDSDDEGQQSSQTGTPGTSTSVPPLPSELYRDVESAVIHTTMGDITVNLFPESAALTVANFAGLADGSAPWTGQEGDEPLYDGTIFHRVIDGFMIQGGDPNGDGTGGPGYRFRDEFDEDLTFAEPYVLAMANTGPNTNGSQFFITVAPVEDLDGRHTIFGEVADEASREVVDEIASTETDPANNKPVEDVVIEHITINE